MLYENDRDLYRYLDDQSINKDYRGGFQKTNWKEALEWNQKNFGIFWTVNQFDGPRRNANLKKFLSWAIEIDSGSKKEQSRLISEFLTPSLVIESKRGFHVYYNATPDTGIEKFKEIVIEHLIPTFGADRGVNDLARVLRAPNFYHMKDPSDPFFVKIVHYDEKIFYTEKQMLEGFPAKTELALTKKNEIKNLKKITREFSDDNLWQRIYEMDCEEGLKKLSGTDAVCGEIYDFKNVGRGRKNIVVNNVMTASFIDEHGRIGSRSGGGPTLWEWLKWFHKNDKVVYKFMKQNFPEIFIQDKTETESEW